MASEKKIIVSGVDNFSTTFQKLNAAEQKLWNQAAEAAKKQGASIKEQLVALERYNRELEKRNRFERMQADIIGKGLYMQDLHDAPSGRARAKVTNNYRRAKSEVAVENLAQQEASLHFRELLEETRKHTKLLEKAEKEKRERISAVDDEWSSKQSLWMQELREDEGGVRGKIKSAKKGDYEGMSDAQREKLQHQEYVLQEKDKNKKEEPKPENLFKSILQLAVIKEAFDTIRNTVGSVAGAQDENFLAGKISGSIVKGVAAGIGGLTGLASAGAGAAIIAGGAITGDVVQGTVERHLDEIKKRQMAGRGLMAMTGKGLTSASQYGVAGFETGDLMKSIAMNFGSSRNLGQRTLDNLAVSSAYGVDRGMVGDSNKISRLTGGNTINEIAALIATMKSRGVIKGDDYTLLTELIQQQNTFLQQQGQILERPNAQVASGVVAAFRSIGGSFGDARAGERLGAINNTLTNPGNDFQKARNFGILNKLKPGASFIELLQMQSQGVSQQGFMGETMKQMEREGGAANLPLFLHKNFGLPIDAAVKLSKSFLSDRSRFDNMTGKQVDDVAGIRSRGEEMTPEIVKSSAEISDAFAKGPVEGFEKALKLGLNKFSKEMEGAIKRAFESADKPVLPPAPKINPVHRGAGGGI